MKNKISQIFLHRHSSAGFTMIELMIVVAIIGIIAAIGYPSYSQYVQKSRRADGQLALMNAVQTMERCKTTRFSYANCTIPVTTSEEGHYTLALAPGLTASKFTVVATPTGQQADDTDCPSLSINELGQNLPADCW